MTEREQRAQALFLEGKNCAQAVLAAYKDWLSLDEKTALTVAAGFGGGMGRTRSVCGAFSAMVMLAPYFVGPDGETEENRAQVYAKVQAMKRAFEEANGSAICADILKRPQQAEAPQ
ncbi:MAG: C_GCAxxG_C_C family protein, partial [Clostridia bacterium]|nr:C_GCAxxG_C_C family protein [Clostridia bacterium]